MLKKKKGDDELAAPASPAKKQDEHAYEDTWYRALKAQSERPAEPVETVETVETVED